MRFSAQNKYGTIQFNRKCTTEYRRRESFSRVIWQLLLTQFAFDFYWIVFNGFEMLPNLRHVVWHCATSKTNYLDVLLWKENDWIVPLPLHKGVIRQTTFIESKTSHCITYRLFLRSQAMLWYHIHPPNATAHCYAHTMSPNMMIRLLKTTSTESECFSFEDLNIRRF